MTTGPGLLPWRRGPGLASPSLRRWRAGWSLFDFADVSVALRWVFLDEPGQQVLRFLEVKVDDLDAVPEHQALTVLPEVR